jgi:hypothetical protein
MAGDTEVMIMFFSGGGGAEDGDTVRVRDEADDDVDLRHLSD